MDRPALPAGPVTVAAGELHLRTWEPQDAEALLRACSDPEVLRWTVLPDPYTPQVAREWVEQAAPGQWATGQGAHFGVFGTESGSLLGGAGLGELADGSAEVGYWIAREARGLGARRGLSRHCAVGASRSSGCSASAGGPWWTTGPPGR